MPKLALYNQQGEQVGELDVLPGLFAVPIKQGALYYTAMVQSARRRRGTASTKTRGEVRGGGAKPWPQKGTGRARHGSTRSPIWTGGGAAFGPRPRSYKLQVPKKVRRAALYSVLSAKARQGKVLVVDEIALSEPRTKIVAGVLQNLNAIQSALIVTARPEQNLVKSARNLPSVATTVAEQLNVLDILTYDYLVFTKEALEKVQEVFGE